MRCDEEQTTKQRRPGKPVNAAPHPSAPHVEVEVTSGTNARSTFLLSHGRYRVGQRAGCDIAIEDPWLSRDHLELVVSEHEIRVKDLGSTNGSFCNGLRFHDRILEPGASVVIGRSFLRIRLLSGVAR